MLLPTTIAKRRQFPIMKSIDITLSTGFAATTSPNPTPDNVIIAAYKLARYASSVGSTMELQDHSYRVRPALPIHHQRHAAQCEA